VATGGGGGSGGWFGGVALAALALVGCEKPVPATPTYTHDVQPILEAHCARCHGAGGTLNIDARSLESTSPPPNGFLNQYDDKVDCTPDANMHYPLTCVGGARYEAETGNIYAFIHGLAQPRMPLAPAAPLDDWELAVLDNWLAEKPPLR
jgi:hypothetical protein